MLLEAKFYLLREGVSYSSLNFGSRAFNGQDTELKSK